MPHPFDRRLLLLAAVSLLAACQPFIHTHPPDGAPPVEHAPFMYSAKFTCVAEVGPAVSGPQTNPGAEVPFLPGVYRTVVNVHNPHEKTITLRKKAVVARSEDIRERGKISEWVKESLKPDEAFAVDCLDIQSLFGGLQPIGDGFVVIESDMPIDVTAVYTSLFIEEKQEILFRLVGEPLTQRAVMRNGTSEPEKLPDLGTPPAAPKPFAKFRPEVIAVDFEKMYGIVNKIIYTYQVPECTGAACIRTREILIEAPPFNTPFPPRGLEDLVKAKDSTFQSIRDVDVTMYEKDEIKQEVTWRWVSDAVKVVVDFKGQYDAKNVTSLVQAQIGALPLGYDIEILDTDIAVGVGQGEDVEQIRPSHRPK